MKECGLMVKNMERENYIHQMEIGDKEFGWKEKGNNGYKLLIVNNFDFFSIFVEIIFLKSVSVQFI